MILLLMGSRGLTFDGLDQSTIQTNVIVETTDKNQAAYFAATNTTNQYTTTASNLEFQANSTAPNFNFENSLGVTTSSNLNAATITLSPSSSTSPVEVIRALAVNMPSNGVIQYVLGKDDSNNSNSYRIQYIYNSTESNRRLVIKPFGYDTAISIYRPYMTAASNTGTLVVNGGLSADDVYTTGAITGSSLNVSSGSITGGSLNVSSGTINCGQLTSTGISTGSGAINSSGTITGTTQTLTKTTPGQILNLTSSESTSTSTTTGLFLVRHNSNSITGDLYTLAEFFSPNMPTTSSSEIRIGRNATSGASYNAFSSMFGYTYNTTESLRKGYIRLNNSSNTIEFFKPSVVGTTASTGSVVINGDIAGLGLRATSLNLYETSSSANAVKLQTATSSSAYTLKFPTNLGSTNDYLQLGSSGQLQWSAGTGGGSGGSAAYVSAASYTSASATYATGSTYKTVAFATNNYDVNTSIGYNPSPGTYPYFRNNSGGTIYVQVNAVVEYSTSTLTSYRQAQLRTTTSSSVDPIGGTSTTIMTSWNAPSTNTSGVGQTCTLSGIVKLLSNECFIIVTRQGTGSDLSATAQIQFQVLGGSGLQSITLNSVSSFLTGTAQTTGLNPTINVGLSQTPTGSGNTLVTNASPTITNIYLRDGIGLNLVSLEAASGTTAYSFIFPTTSGSSGQILTSDGGGSNATKWADVGTYIGTSSSSVTSPLLTLDGTSTSTSIPHLSIRDYGVVSNSIPLFIQAPSISSGNVALRIGVATSTNNSARLNFNYVASGSTSNNVNFTFFGQSESIQIFPNTNSTSSTTGTLVVNGGVGVSGKSVYGSSTTSTSSDPILDIQGLSSTSIQPPLSVKNYDTGSCATISAFSPSLAAGAQSIIRFGVGLTTLNSASMRFNYTGSGSTSNYIDFSHYAQGSSIKIYKDSTPATTTTTGTLVVNGGIGCTNLVTDTLTVNSTSYGFSSGQLTDLQLSYGYDTDYPFSVTVTYPNIPYFNSGTYNGQIPNRRYDWQQIGKSYSFSLNLYCRVSVVQNKQLHIVFLKSDTHTIPTPAGAPDGYVTGIIPPSVGDPGYWGSNVNFGLGVYIPAT